MTIVYWDRNNNLFPLYEGDVKLTDPKWEVGKDLPENWVAVEFVEPPASSQTSYAEIQTPVEIDGKWVMSWKVTEISQADYDAWREKADLVHQEIAKRTGNEIIEPTQGVNE